MIPEPPKDPTPPKFNSLTQARATRDRLAQSVLWAFEEILPDDAESMVENVCCAGEDWMADARKIEHLLASKDNSDGEEQIGALRDTVEWIRDEERKQLDAALAAQRQ